MPSNPLLVFDCDGVIVDGMYEYWSSSRQACIDLLGAEITIPTLPKDVPQAFQKLRPWVHQGWEMVVIAAELLRHKSPLLSKHPKNFSSNYSIYCQLALQAWSWDSNSVQKALDNVRRQALLQDKAGWLALHQPFPEVLQLIQSLKGQGIDFAVLTTKSAEFTQEILESLQIKPNHLFGHESGSKAKILLELAQERSILGLIEDRRKTLEEINSIAELSALPCYLASWGYLKPEDKKNLPQKISLLRPEELSTPLASWH